MIGGSTAGEKVRELKDRVLERWFPGALWRRYERLARAAGWERVHFVLSFDCDTPEDADAAEQVGGAVMDLGVRPVFAVAGELLERGEKIYTRLRARGAVFLNHGHRQHTRFDAALGRYVSCRFYHTQSPAEIEADVSAGDAAFRRVFGEAPRGFRTPHFGTHQSAAALTHLHRFLGQKGYAYSSSTLPAWAFRRGPVFDDFGLPEFPLSGSGDRPLTLLDSWSWFAAPDRRETEADYVRRIEAAARRASERGVGLLNFYVDPVHVVGKPVFIDAVKICLANAVNTTYDDLLAGRARGR